MDPNIPVHKYMTFLAKTIDADQTIAQAREVMRKLHLRHLPVFKGEKLVGVLTDRDINLVLSFAEIDSQKLKIRNIAIPEFNIALPTTSILEVVNQMIEGHYCSTVIMENGKLLGIFTETDAYKVLSTLLA